MTVDERIEANADLVRWCVHVLGPDDVIAAPSHAAAVSHAQKVNEAVLGRDNSRDYVLCFAYAAPWPHTPAQHDADVKNWPGSQN